MIAFGTRAWFAGSLLAISLTAVSYANEQVGNIRQRIEERRAERQQNRSENQDSAFPAKGSLSTAQSRTISSGSLKRHYLIQIPEGKGPFPVVVLLHGATQNGERVWTQTSLPTLGVREGFIVVAPDGINGQWNDGRLFTKSGNTSSADDVGFLQSLIIEVTATAKGDPSAIFMIGASNGGLMTMRFACDKAQTLRAAGNAISNLPTGNDATCRPDKQLPWISINGTADKIMPFDGQGEVNNHRGHRPAEAIIHLTLAIERHNFVGSSVNRNPRQ